MPRATDFLRHLLASWLLVVTAHALTVDRLQVESRQQPLGVDTREPRLSWKLFSDQRAQTQTAYQILVASSVEKLAAGHADAWDTGKVTSTENFGVEYSGPALRSDDRYFWQVRVWDGKDRPSDWSKPTWWQMGLLAATDWKGQWISAAPDASSPLLRRDFHAGKKIARATAYAYATGWYRLFLNGTELTERVLTPVNSNYPKGLFYDTYDVTSLASTGQNAVGLWLGQGYNQTYSKWGYRWDAPPSALLQLEILYTDGSTQTINSDREWRWTASPVIENDIYNGESYDARREIPDWSLPGFDARGWNQVELRTAPAGTLMSCPFPSLAVAGNVHPVKITEPKPGVFIFDLGQNIAGWVQLKTSGAAGTPIVMRHAETLLADGTLDTKTNRLARATDTYTFSGRGVESYEPRFTYHGFRYVEVTGLSKKPPLDTITGRVVHAALEEAGAFKSSDAFINRLHKTFRWSIANNLYGIPTDTATRDERTPCQMDSLAVEDAAICNFAVGPYYTKWLHDIAGDGGTLPSWTGDQVVLPFLLYENYGDRRILQQHIGNMKAVVDKFAATAEENKQWAGGYGDWAAPNPDGSFEGSFSEGELVARAFFFRCARIVAETSALLGNSTDAEKYRTLAEEIRTAFNQRFFNSKTATYSSGRQVTSIIPLAFGLVAPEHRTAVVAALRQRIIETDRSHLDTGIFGSRYLFEVLIDHGFTDLVFQIFTSKEFPGYGHQMDQGATTTWEQWTYAGSMQTHDHAMFSGPDDTFFTRLGGIRAAAPGFRKITIRPAMPAALSFVECSRETPMGKILTHWQRSEGRLVLRVNIPANASADVHLPVEDTNAITESGAPLATAGGVLSVTAAAGETVVTIASGDYEFSISTLSINPVRSL